MAAKSLINLLKQNPEAQDFIQLLKENNGVDAADYEANLAFYQDLEKKFPESKALKR